MNRADLKQRAKAQLGGSIFGSVWLYAVLVFFINALIQLVGGQIPLLGRVVGLLLTGPLSYGIAKMLLKQSRDGQAMNVAEMFDGFKDDFGGNFLLHLLMSIFIALWSLLLVVPGIIKALGWSMAYLHQGRAPGVHLEAVPGCQHCPDQRPQGRSVRAAPELHRLVLCGLAVPGRRHPVGDALSSGDPDPVLPLAEVPAVQHLPSRRRCLSEDLRTKKPSEMPLQPTRRSGIFAPRPTRRAAKNG